MGEVRLIPWTPESPAVLPPSNSSVANYFLSAIENLQIDFSQDIQYFQLYSQNVIALNSARYQSPFRHLHKTSAHDPEVLQNLSEGLKNNPHVFLRTKCACLTDIAYWFTHNDLEKNLKHIVSSLYLKGLIGSKLRLDIEPFETVSKALAMDFRMGLTIAGDLGVKTKAFFFILPYYLKLVSVAKRVFELMGENPAIQEQIQARLTHLNVMSFEQLKESHVHELYDLDNLFNQALKEDKNHYSSRLVADDYELVDGDKRFKIPKNTTIIYPCTNWENPPCPGFQSGILILRLLFIFLLMKGRIEKETKKVWGPLYIPATKTSFVFKSK